MHQQSTGHKQVQANDCVLAQNQVIQLQLAAREHVLPGQVGEQDGRMDGPVSEGVGLFVPVMYPLDKKIMFIKIFVVSHGL